MLTGSQLRAARGLLNLSVTDLTERTGLAVNTIRRAEGTNEVAPISQANMRLLETTLRDLGVVFLAADDLGVGVRLKCAEPLPLQKRRRPGEKV